MKIMVLVLGVLVLVAVALAFRHGPAGDPTYVHPAIFSTAGLTFLLALMGWMPAPLEIGAWSSLWVLEKNKSQPKRPTMFQAMVDYNLGYIATAILALAFVSFGALVMYGTGTEFSPRAVRFSAQLVEMFTSTLGQWSSWVITLVAFITMFSTTLTVLDGYSRTLSVGVPLATGRSVSKGRTLYLVLMSLLMVFAVLIIAFFVSNMKTLIDVVTVLAFLTAPLVAILNFRVVRGQNVPPEHRPGPFMTGLSWAGIIFLTGFGLVWIVVRYL